MFGFEMRHFLRPKSSHFSPFRYAPFITQSSGLNTNVIVLYYEYLSCMRLHVCACKFKCGYRCPAPVLVRSEASHAGALKAPDEAGRRGGDSIARWRYCACIFALPESAVVRLVFGAIHTSILHIANVIEGATGT